MLDAMDSLPSLDDPRAPSADEKAAFDANGWTVVRGLCAPQEAAAYGDAIREATVAHNTESRPLAERDTYGKAFLQTMNLWRVDSRVARFTLACRFASMAAGLLGVEKVRLYHDQSLFKEPGGGHTPWHQDGSFWPLDQSRTITMWMPLVDASAEMGTMSFADGSHRRGLIEKTPGISDRTEVFFQKFIEGEGLHVGTAGAMRAGDATFHSGLTLHGAPGNPTDRVRAVMTVIYLADGMTVTEPKNPGQVNDLATWLPGLRPGDLAASELNPVV